GEPLLASTPIEQGRYTALSPGRPLSKWFERLVQDLWGYTAVGAIDERPWLDHGHWEQVHPMALRPGPADGRREPPEFLPVGEELNQVRLGPIPGGISAAA